MPAGIHVADHVRGRRLEIRASKSFNDQRIVVDHTLGVGVPPPGEIRARFRGEKVFLLMGLKQLEMSIPVAAKVGYALANNGGAALYLGGFVSLKVGGEKYSLPGETSIQLGGVLMKKTDRADDWQRANPKRR